MLESLFNKNEPSGLELYENETPTQVFSCKICKIFKNTYFEEHLQTTALVRPHTEIENGKIKKRKKYHPDSFNTAILFVDFEQTFINWVTYL